jgi:phytanoyl-CoA hydroxylase
VFTDLFSDVQLLRARAEIFELFHRRFGDVDAAGLTDERLLQHYSEVDKQRWRECARRMWDLLGVYALAAEPAVDTALRHLGLVQPIISTRPEVRTDMPGDEQYMQPWHQDWRYGQGSVNAVTIWTPLRDVGVDDGTIDVMPGSHLFGYLENEELDNPRRFSIVDPRIERQDYLPAELRFGESIVFSQMLVHRSGYNKSGLARVTVQQRFSDAAEPEFARRGFPMPTGSELVWDTPPSSDDMAAAFGAPASARVREVLE